MAFAKVVVGAGVVTGIIFLVIVSRTLKVGRPQEVVQCARSAHWINATDAVIARFTGAVRIATISREQGDISEENLKILHNHIIKSYPILHSSPLVKQEVVGNYSLLYTIQGSHKSLKPYLLAAHLDVVPVNEDNWEVPPFSGQIRDGFIYGRGTIDDKHAVMGILEAIEAHLKSGFVPKRTIYLAFGHDEEIRGYHGAGEIGKILQSRKVHLEFLLDEGLIIMKDIVKMVKVPVANIGVAEKGFLTLKLSVNATPGHSSMPPPHTAIGIMAKAITRLEDNPQPIMFGKVVTTMLEQMAPYSNLPLRAVFANLWAFSPIVSWFMSKDPMLNSLQRTTTAVTIINGGTKSNVLPDRVTATINHRVQPGQTIANVIAYDMNVINDERVTITVEDESEASPISPYVDVYGYELIKTSIYEIFPEVAVVPGILIAATDCKWYLDLTDHIYRFTPTIMTPTDLPRYHGDNERISIDNYERLVNFYHHVILNAEKESLEQFVLQQKIEL